ncbi:replication initiation protein [Paracoccus fontiphilus]|uniref:Replication initiation protein n=1 Tax=Paracoccus fontiphilus TaxID=1815556 RepID=A0ABV7INU8_9RHOB|nr:replication initiation protein [Paracoccus fontiphilus]
MESPASSNVLPLFDTEDLKQISASGSVWTVDRKDPATVPVPLQVVMVNVDGPYTERDRKLWTFLLHAVWDELGEKPLHELPVSEINRVFRELGGDHNTAWIWESARRLAKTTVEWKATLGDERVQGVSSIFGAELSKSSRTAGRLKFHFPPLLIPVIKQPLRFARLRVHFMLGLSGKYAVTLYELLEGFANRRDGLFECSIDELRQWLKVPDGSYKDWKDLKKWVLNPSIGQINADPLAAGFSVEYEAIREGRFYTRLRFRLVKAKQREMTERKIKSRVNIAKAVAEGRAQHRPALLPQTVEKARHATHYKLDMDIVTREFWDHWDATGRPDFIKGIEAAFIGFAKRKARQLR